MFTLTSKEREAELMPQLAELVEHHRAACLPYARILEAGGHGPGRRYGGIADLPWLPVGIFQEHRLLSTPTAPAWHVLTSSGTTGARLTHVQADRLTAERQRRLLATTLGAVLEGRRPPLLIVDSPAAVREERSGVRATTTLGVMDVGRDVTFALNAQGVLDRVAVSRFLLRHGRAPFLVFGFTFLIWTHLGPDAGRRLDLSHGTLLHSGGWRRLADQAVTPVEFRETLARECGLARIHHFYGMAEQAGTIHVESANGDGLYSPDFADVVIRDPETWQEAPVGTPGLIELVSTVPRARPAHILLTEDLGVVEGVDDGVWPGKRFTVLGRLPAAEPRGWSGTGGHR